MASAAKFVAFTSFVMALSPLCTLADTCPAGAKAFTTPAAASASGEITLADLFTVTYYSTYKVVSYSNTLGVYKGGWPNGAGGLIPDLVLYQCGTDMPTTANNGVTDGAYFFEIPIQRAALPWTGVLHFFEMLSVTEAIGQIDMRYISSPCGQLLEVCTPGIHESTSSSNWRTHVADADAVFTDSWGSGFSNSSRDVVFDVTFEPGALQRAEWLRFLALFFNEEDMADEIMGRIETDYAALKAEAARLQSEDAGGFGGKPKAAWVSSAPHTCPDTYTCESAGWKNVDGSWCQCGGWVLSNAHYKRELVVDAGAELVAVPAVLDDACDLTTGNDGATSYACLTPAAAHFKALLLEADVIFDETSGAADYSQQDFITNFGITVAESPALQRGALYRIDGSGSDGHESGTSGSNWFEQMPAQPQQILSDVMMAVWGDAFSTGQCSMKFLRHVPSDAEKTLLGHTDCPLHDVGGNHDCAGIHDYEHEVPICAAPAMADVATMTPTPVNLLVGLVSLWLLA
mmetsp:Transcript_48743/g.89916  ORF Transcript_48743/g.89916 Transcript_48743/m.89916 type:complete len:516 (-) Transcript_48743:104-1651(-)